MSERADFLDCSPNNAGRGRPGLYLLFHPLRIIRFQKGESAASIAMNRSGKAVQVATVIGHILTATSFGDRPVNLRRLAAESDPGSVPTRKEWAKLEEAASIADVDVVETKAFFAKEVRLI